MLCHLLTSTRFSHFSRSLGPSSGPNHANHFQMGKTEKNSWLREIEGSSDKSFPSLRSCTVVPTRHTKAQEGARSSTFAYLFTSGCIFTIFALSPTKCVEASLIFSLSLSLFSLDIPHCCCCCCCCCWYASYHHAANWTAQQLVTCGGEEAKQK